MIGLHFVHFNEDAPGRLNVRTGTVKQKVGDKHYLLEFQGRDYRFSNIFSAEKLEAFAFFATPEEQEAFLTELKAQTARVITEQASQEAPPAN